MSTMTADIARYRRQLIAKYQKHGLYENFGQKEVLALRDKYGVDYTCHNTTKPIDDFDEWCMDFTGIDN